MYFSKHHFSAHIWIQICFLFPFVLLVIIFRRNTFNLVHFHINHPLNGGVAPFFIHPSASCIWINWKTNRVFFENVILLKISYTEYLTNDVSILTYLLQLQELTWDFFPRSQRKDPSLLLKRVVTISEFLGGSLLQIRII